MTEERYIGKVVWFTRCFGFISRDGQDDIFVHWSDIDQESGYKTLRKGQTVAFSIGFNKRQQPKAVNVAVINAEKLDSGVLGN
jgi:cold shock protein